MYTFSMIPKLIALATISCVLIDSCLCSKSVYCTDKLNSPDKDAANISRIFKELTALTLTTEIKNGTDPPVQYVIAVCGDAHQSDPLAGAVRISQNKVTVLGRVNNTQAVLGDSWMMVMLGDGDSAGNGTACNGSHLTTVLFLCKDTPQGELYFLKEFKEKSDLCSCIMEVKTSVVCPHKIVDESTSHSFLVFTITLSIILVYFVCGALYRRFALGAKGMEQIPHIAFWSQLFENCRMFCCRRRRSSTSLWHGNEDRDDDSLLQP